MNFFLTLRVAARALRKNKLRAGLTVLGIVIGVAAVIAMVSMGQSATALIEDQLYGLGTNLVVVFPGSNERGGARSGAGGIKSLTAADADAIERECPTILAASPIVVSQGQIIYGNNNWWPQDFVGVDPDFLLIRNWPLARGDFFTEREVTSAAKVCVIGRTVVEKLFQTSDPIGRTVRIKNIPFTVIGVLEEKGANMVGQDQDNIVVAPYTTVRTRITGSAFDNVDHIIASGRTHHAMFESEVEITALLHDRHRIKPGELDDFEVGNTAEMASVLGMVTNIMTYLLAAIASVSLLVGGVGIMNIMLVSVKERTREIGIRMAVGARSGDILRQFLIEAVLLATLGGLVGVALGIGAALTITQVINYLSPGTDWPTVISIWPIAIALCFSSGVGLFFGFYPALQASRLDPIDALRYE